MDKQYQIPSSIAYKLEQIKLYMGTHSVTAFCWCRIQHECRNPQQCEHEDMGTASGGVLRQVVSQQ